MLPTPRLLPLFALAALLPLGACTPRSARGAGEIGGGQVITAEMIRDSGLSDAWEVLRHYANHLSFQEHAALGPVAASRRGRESIYLAEDPLLVVDGARIDDFRSLSGMPARDIETMRILSAIEASTRFGMRAAGGAIIVETIKPVP